jgi:glycosyltransferase involved in cell wall biosynthesis
MVGALGLSPAKVVPWDWSKVPVVPEVKLAVAVAHKPTAFFAGILSEDKGVGDCLNAVKLLSEQGIMMSMCFAGPGDISPWLARAEKLGISGQVNFLGLIPNVDVRREMRRHDFVIVPSRHSYPEGLPNTIYEGLASRSVLIISDHPAFTGRLRNHTDCLVFQSENPRELADRIKRCVYDSNLYGRISNNSREAHENLYVGMRWDDLVMNFIEDPLDQAGWVFPNSIANIENSIE